MSTRELFGDDDSSSEEEEEETKKQEPTTTTTTTSPKESKETATAATAAAPNKNDQDDDDDDDDEGDEEFDDQGAVVGLSSTTLAGTKTSAAPSTAMQVDKDDDNETQKEDAPPKEPDIMVVPELATASRPNGQEIYMTKLPNLVGIQTTAFDPETYSPLTEQDEFGPQSAHNLMRWRYNEKERQSNTRLVQWDDGSWTLHIGKEAFEVDIVNHEKQGFAGLNGYLYLTQKASVRNNGDETAGNETVLECLGPVTSRMTVRPSSLQSEAHKSLTLAVRQKTIKRARIAEFTTTEDPEKLKEERIKVKQDLEKAAMRKQGGYNDAYRRNVGGGRRPRMARSYLEDDEDFDTTNIRAMKKGIYDRDMDDFGDEYDDDEDEEDDEETFHRVRPKQKGAKASKKTGGSEDEEEDEDITFEDEDDEDEVTPVKKQNKKRPAQSVFDDDSD